jgi:hypothetical protein
MFKIELDTKPARLSAHGSTALNRSNQDEIIDMKKILKLVCHKKYTIQSLFLQRSHFHANNNQSLQS